MNRFEQYFANETDLSFRVRPAMNIFPVNSMVLLFLRAVSWTRLWVATVVTKSDSLGLEELTVFSINYELLLDTHEANVSCKKSPGDSIVIL